MEDTMVQQYWRRAGRAGGEGEGEGEEAGGDEVGRGQRRRLRVLDVGSCYNPFASPACASRRLFDVLALDLHPAQATAQAAADADACASAGDGEGDGALVNREDGRGGGGGSGSGSRRRGGGAMGGRGHGVLPVGEGVLQCDFLTVGRLPPGSAPVLADPDPDSEQDPDPPRQLVALPVDCFDAATLSLVLSFVPSPALRTHMVANARAHLASPRPRRPSGAAGEAGPGPGSESQPGGLLLIADVLSVFGGGAVGRLLLRHWRAEVAAQRFSWLRRARASPTSAPAPLPICPLCLVPVGLKWSTKFNLT
jgi:hypothetical protein